MATVAISFDFREQQPSILLEKLSEIKEIAKIFNYEGNSITPLPDIKGIVEDAIKDMPIITYFNKNNSLIVSQRTINIITNEVGTEGVIDFIKKYYGILFGFLSKSQLSARRVRVEYSNATNRSITIKEIKQEEVKESLVHWVVERHIDNRSYFIATKIEQYAQLKRATYSFATKLDSDCNYDKELNTMISFVKEAMDNDNK